jgi:hypothetical protein
MSENEAPRRNPLDDLFGEKQIRVAVLNADQEPTGVVGVFHNIAPQHKARYDQIIQKGFGGRKPKYDEAQRYAFPKVIDAIEGLTEDDCEGMPPIKYCQQTPKGDRLLMLLMDGFWLQASPSTEADTAKK